MSFVLALPLLGVLTQAQVVRPEPPLREVLRLPARPAELLLGAQDIVSLKDGSFVVSDKLDYKLKKFDKHGKLVKEAGKRGGGAGEFRGPGPLTAYDKVIAVADYATSRVQVFNANLEFKSGFHAPGAVFDLCFDHQGSLWAGVLTGRKDETLVQMDLSGKVLQSLSPRNCTDDPFDNIFWLTVDRTDEIIVAYASQNKVEIWDTRGNYKSEFTVSGLPARSKRIAIAKKLIGNDLTVPEDNLFWNLGVDSRGRILLLADEYTPNPDQDVYILDKRGTLLSLLKLPHPTVGISVDPKDRIMTIDAGRNVIRIFQAKK